MLICIDLDDTLIANAYTYHESIWECAGLICRALGYKSIHPTKLLSISDETDAELVKTMGLHPDRFPMGWLATYKRACMMTGVAECEETATQIQKAAEKFKDHAFLPFDGVVEALSELRAQGHQLHLVTAGDVDLQTLKIERSGLRGYFSSLHITPLKKLEILRSLKEDYERQCVNGESVQCIMIGDSKRSDIAPAKELGMTTVWIPSQTWGYANDDVEPDFTINSFVELPALVAKL